MKNKATRRCGVPSARRRSRRGRDTIALSRSGFTSSAWDRSGHLSLAAEDEASTAVRVVFERLSAAPDLDNPARRHDLRIELIRLGTAKSTVGPLPGLRSLNLHIARVA
jgi:hypothetical protein